MRETRSERYHRLSSYRLSVRRPAPPDALMRPDVVPQSEEDRPPSAKVYDGALPRLALPTRGPESAVPASHLLAAAASKPAQFSGLSQRALTLSDLARILRFSAGRVREHVNASGDTVWYRAAPSAGNLHPVEIYLHSAGVNGLGDGVWYYNAAAHCLVRVGGTVAASTLLILTAIPWRTQWKYRERGYRHIWWDAGAVLANLELIALASGIKLRTRLDFPDAAIAGVVGADEAHELPAVVVELGAPLASLRRPAEPPVAGYAGAPGPGFPLVRDAHEAGRLDAWPPIPAGCEQKPAPDPQPPPPAPHEDLGLSAENLIRRRSTIRSFGPKPVSADAMSWTLSVAASSPCWDGDHVSPGYSVFIHNVTSHRSGCYQAAGASRNEIFIGDARLYAQAACLDQPAAADCSYLALLSVDMQSYLGRRGDRGYRFLQTYAGWAAARLQLAAVCLGLGSTLLTIRDEFAMRFSPPGMVPLIAVAVGLRRESGSHN